MSRRRRSQKIVLPKPALLWACLLGPGVVAVLANLALPTTAAGTGTILVYTGCVVVLAGAGWNDAWHDGPLRLRRRVWMTAVCTIAGIAAVFTSVASVSAVLRLRGERVLATVVSETARDPWGDKSNALHYYYVLRRPDGRIIEPELERLEDAYQVGDQVDVWYDSAGLADVVPAAEQPRARDALLTVAVPYALTIALAAVGMRPWRAELRGRR
jgi:hypothetical protein